MNTHPDTLMALMQKKNQQLALKNEDMLNLSEKKASAKRDYRIQSRITQLEYKSKGHPATLIKSLVNGDTIVAELKYKQDVAEGVYFACLESIKDLRIAIDSARSMLSYAKEHGA